MKFTLTESVITDAIKGYLNTLISINPDATINIDFKATRGSDGATAEIDVDLLGAKAVPAKQEQVKHTAEVEPVIPEAPVAEVEELLEEPAPRKLFNFTADA